MPFSSLLLSPPGDGKSTMASTIQMLTGDKKTLLLACKAREANSWGYQQVDGIDTELYHDPRWVPSLDRFQADAHIKLLRRLDSLYDDTEYGAVIIDPFTDAALNLGHEILKAAGVGSVGGLGDTQSYYASLKDGANELIDLATGLVSSAAKLPKYLVVTMHVQPPKEDVTRGGITKPSADKVARGIEYEGSVLPMIDGAYRRKMAGDFDMVLYLGFEEKLDRSEKPPRQKPYYYAQISPDRDRHSKIAIGIPQTDKIPNDFSKLLEAIK